MRDRPIEGCAWCATKDGNILLDFSVIDDAYGNRVPMRSIKYCPFCGRELKWR